ncbi:MAG: flagellar hook-associated protein FlgL [Bacteriovoracaceae bacterium]|nr:flagellar hook-associated protein FlgL [Bacteriovoracaceae bacterium]
MTRVSEGSTSHAINFSLGKAKSHMEDLQIKGSNLKKVQKPSDDPIGNVELMAIRSKKVDNDQYTRNTNYAKMYLEYTEQAISDLTELVSKAKEIAIGQSSDIYNPQVRESVAKEINQLRTQALGIANRRVGNRYIFSGFKTLTRPFDEKGAYSGDNGRINLEVGKDFFVAVNMNGSEIFYETADRSLSTKKPLDGTPFEDLKKFKENPEMMPELEETAVNPLERVPASNLNNNEKVELKKPGQTADGKINPESTTFDEAPARQSIFDHLQSLENALLANNPEVIHTLLERFDEHFDRLVTMRTRVGALYNSVNNSEGNIEKENLLNEEYKSRIQDADVAELFSDISKQNSVLQASYKASSNLLNRTLLDFIR